MRFALNHITAPGLSLPAFFALARRLSLTEVELRNDLKGAPIADGTSPAEVKAAAEAAGVTILTINALYPFNLWSPDLKAKAEALADYAVACGAKALVMCPLNDGKLVPRDQLVAGLAGIKPILDARGLTGLVEPLGFPRSSLRTKAEAVSAIQEAGAQGTYKLVHDTFHHYLAGETAFFPDWTGLVHISGVADPALTPATMEDDHRILVDHADRLGNLPQIRQLQALGYTGAFSFEPFSPVVQALTDPEAALKTSMDFIRATL